MAVVLFLILSPLVSIQAASGAEPAISKDRPLELTKENKECLVSHGLLGAKTPKDKETLRTYCLCCHGLELLKHDAGPMGRSSLPDTELSILPSHRSLSCLECHLDSDGDGHRHQKPVRCQPCHTPHPTHIANDPHTQVACKACHMEDVALRRESSSGRVIAELIAPPSGKSNIHNMMMVKPEETCSRCHKKANGIGAAPLVLPAKSMICLPCHSATISMGDPISIVSLLFLVFGSVLTVSVWLAGGFPEKKEPRTPVITPLPTLLFRTGAALIKDALLNRKLFTKSPLRWLIHAMIVFPFLFRGLWGLTGLFASHVLPGWSVTWLLMDRNFYVTAFVFDASGLMVISGVILALLRKAVGKAALPGLPKIDLPALALIGGVILVGFVLEAVRMTMAPLPPGSQYAFVGYGLSRLLAIGPPLDAIYGMIWYVHAGLVGIFLAYLPFSRLRHILIAPIATALNSVRAQRQSHLRKERR